MSAIREKRFRRFVLSLAALVISVCFGALPVAAQSSLDRVYRQNGVDSGRITGVTALGLTISKGSVESTVAAEDIEKVQLAGEPPELNTARNALLAGRTQEALDLLTKIPAASVSREEMAAELDFYTVLAKAELALAGQGAPDAVAAEVRAFMARRNKSFHIPQAIELSGDLLTAAGQYRPARAEYAKLAKANTQFFQMKSALLVGRAWQAEGDHAQALAQFDAVLAAPDQSPKVAPLRLAATLDRAVSQAAAGKVDEAAAAIGEIIAKANPEDAKLLARAYNALGDCYLKSGDNRGALFAFLHVDLLYNKDANAHAKALHELAALWKTVGRDTRAQEATAELMQKYPNSRWVRK